MAGDRQKFTKLKLKNLGVVAFGNNGKLKIIEKDNIELKCNFIIWKVILVDKFRFNLLNVSQLSDARYKVKFQSTQCLIKHVECPN